MDSVHTREKDCESSSDLRTGGHCTAWASSSAASFRRRGTCTTGRYL